MLIINGLAAFKSANVKKITMRTILYLTIFFSVMASCKKGNEARKMDPVFFPTDMLFEDLELPRFSQRIPDADFSTGPATFSARKNGADWTGFAISNRNYRTFVTNETALDSTKFSAYTGTLPHAGGNFLVVRPKDDEAQINFSRPLEIDKLLITPTTFLYQTMMYGDSTTSAGKKVYTYAHGNRTLTVARKDYIKVVIDGYNGAAHTGTVDFFLADRQSDDRKRNFTLADWTPVSLEELGTVTRIVFSLESTVVNGAGEMVTPPYFCIDGIRFKESVY